MVDELELLKKDWQKQEASLPKVTAKEIYPMLLKKSSSIVKWIFIISIIEFGFWVILTLIPVSPETTAFLEKSHLETFNTVLLIVQFSGLAFFIGWFYKNYRKIKTTDSSSVLMSNILNTRKTVKYYVWFNLSLFATSLFIIFNYLMNHQELKPEGLSEVSSSQLGTVFGIIALVFFGILWLFYRIIYGTLARRLKDNHKELQKMEI